MTEAAFLIVCDEAAVPAPLRDDRSLIRRAVRRTGPSADLNLRADNVSATVLSQVGNLATDLANIAAYVYAADQEISRGGQADVYRDRWRRRITMCVPVIEPDFWNGADVRRRLVAVLNFLTEDTW